VIGKKPNILVIGDLMIDHYLWGNTSRISPEAPVQVIDIQNETYILGGAGNVVNNLVTLGSNVMVMSVLGDDENAKTLTSMFENINAKHYLILDETRKTTKKSRLIASAQQIVRYDIEYNNDLSQKFEDAIFVKFLEIISQFDLVILSDYGKGVLTTTLVSKIMTILNNNNIKALVDPKGNNYTKYRGAYLLTPNKYEAQKATNIIIKNEESLKMALKKLHNDALLQIPMITLSEDGIAILDENDNVIIKPTVVKEVFDVTGAGDTVIASLGYYLAQNKNIFDSVEFANLAAGVVVGKIGSATASLEEIEEYKSSIHKSSIESHIKTFDEIKMTIKRLKKLNKKVVFTNGCFDILHKGHVSYLDTAKSFGDILILGLNSDESVKRLKGNSRPINNENDRAFILAALESVDYVVKFTEDTPYKLISIVAPDILVKGGDYKNKEIIGSDIAKKVKLVQFIDGKSTTKTISQIQKG
jgi:D-beta-D-heptose 7-phosphate kinase/D-beta-D-heptose 1-phosphate adenosyltransferase